MGLTSQRSVGKEERFTKGSARLIHRLARFVVLFLTRTDHFRGFHGVRSCNHLYTFCVRSGDFKDTCGRLQTRQQSLPQKHAVGPIDIGMGRHGDGHCEMMHPKRPLLGLKPKPCAVLYVRLCALCSKMDLLRVCRFRILRCLTTSIECGVGAFARCRRTSRENTSQPSSRDACPV